MSEAEFLTCPTPDERPDLWPWSAAREGGVLRVGGVDLTSVADEFGTPTFVLDVEAMRGRARVWASAMAEEFWDGYGMSGGDAFYAGKAFLSADVARLVAAEVMRFCQAFILELHRNIGENCDVPAGDIGVGGREVGYMFGAYKKYTREFAGVLTGKGLEFGGSLIRPEATGYGNVYFLMEMLRTRGTDLKGKTVLISGAGNVAQYTAEKVLELGGKVLTMSDSDGFVYDPDGIDREKLDYIMELKNLYRGRMREYVEEYPTAQYFEGQKPWGIKADIALPSATQNELNGEHARTLLANGVMAVSEGANMPCTPEAVHLFQEARILYAPGKAANAGGVSVSGLEMSQNSARLSWTAEEVDARLHQIMESIHAACVQYGTEADGYVNYVRGANVAGFMKVAKAMMAQGVI